MATGPLVWPQCPATCHKGAGMATGSGKRQQGGWDGNWAWKHATREDEMATGSGQMAPGRLGWQQGLARWNQGGWDGNRAACMATVPGHMPQGGWNGNRVWPKRQHGGWDGNWAWPHATREAEMATGSGQMAPGRLGWQQGLVTCHQGG